MTQHQPLFHITSITTLNPSYSSHCRCSKMNGTHSTHPVAKLSPKWRRHTTWELYGQHSGKLETTWHHNFETTFWQHRKQLGDNFTTLGQDKGQLWDNLERNLGRHWDIVGTTLRQFWVHIVTTFGTCFGQHMAIFWIGNGGRTLDFQNLDIATLDFPNFQPSLPSILQRVNWWC